MSHYFTFENPEPYRELISAKLKTEKPSGLTSACLTRCELPPDFPRERKMEKERNKEAQRKSLGVYVTSL